MEKQKKKKTGWHRILAKIWLEWLTPVGVTVQPDIPVLAQPPEADILLVRRQGKHWTKEQMERLPDGIRNSNAPNILVEFKATESINAKAVQQIEQYDRHYLESQKLQRSCKVFW